VSSPSLTRVASYRRTVHASEARVWENVRDWEHLPWLHAASFRSIDCLDEGAWGWRARIGLEPAREIELELRIDSASSRYVSRTLDGPGQGSEIWTRVSPLAAERTEVEVEFWLPAVDPARAAELGSAYTRLYQRLWDEDEEMMVRRAEQLAAARAGEPEPKVPLPLGPLAALRARLPALVEWGGRRWRIVEVGGQLAVHATVCPHRLGPLEDAPVEADGCVRCPWHGYRFDVQSGHSADGRRLRLARAPELSIDARGELWIGGPAPSLSSAPAAR
jgi:nitrite reductase/ring-hydroxylating ferredoxin subunit